MIEFGPNIPWQDNWPVYRQLWAFANSRAPGDELDLSSPAGRVLTAQWRDSTGAIAYAKNESDPSGTIKVEHAKRGVVEVVPSGTIWNHLKQGQTYQLEILAYGILYSSTEYRIAMPQPGSEIINGVEVYGAPRQILELLGPIPGASVEVSVPIRGWALDARGYWTRTIPAAMSVYGLWVNDHHARQVSYAELATSGQRGWSRVQSSAESHTLYYKGHEDLTVEFVETAYSRYVLRCLQEATAEVDRKTGTFFNLRRVYREVHRGLRGQRQIVTRHRPLQIDQGFRLDAYSYTRSLYRRYSETDFSPGGNFAGMSEALHADGPTGTITINANIWDFWDWGNYQNADYGLGSFTTLPKGENNVEISYIGGYELMPADVDEAASNLAGVRQAIYWQQALTQGMSGVSIGCVNLNFSELFSKWTPGWQQSADLILAGYTHIEIEAL